MKKALIIFLVFNFINTIFPKELRIGYLSSWQIPCGIAEYTNHIHSALLKRNVFVKVYNNKNHFNYTKHKVLQDKINILNIQYESNFFSSINELISFIKSIKRLGVKVIVTVHSDNKDIEKLSREVDKLIYHKNLMFNLKTSKVKQIPMGIPSYNSGYSKQDLRNKYGFSETDKIIVTTGFPFKAKNLDINLELLLKAIKDNPDYKIQLITPNNGVVKDTIEVNLRLKEIIKSSGVSDRVIHITNFVPLTEFLDRIFISDLGFQWMTNQFNQATSAAAKDYISARVPLVVPNVSHYHDIVKGCVKTIYDHSVFIKTIINTLENEELLSKLKIEQEEMYRRLNYDVLINKHIKLFHRVIR